jgi:alpha-glucuronidase
MKSGNTLWDELCMKYYSGVDQVRKIQQKWNTLEGKIDEERFTHVQSLLKIHLRDAIEWRNACLLYFQTFSKMPIPDKYEQPDKTLKHYMKVDRKYLPGS